MFIKNNLNCTVTYVFTLALTYFSYIFDMEMSTYSESYIFLTICNVKKIRKIGKKEKKINKKAHHHMPSKRWLHMTACQLLILASACHVDKRL